MHSLRRREERLTGLVGGGGEVVHGAAGDQAGILAQHLVVVQVGEALDLVPVGVAEQLICGARAAHRIRPLLLHHVKQVRQELLLHRRRLCQAQRLQVPTTQPA